MGCDDAAAPAVDVCGAELDVVVGVDDTLMEFNVPENNMEKSVWTGSGLPSVRMAVGAASIFVVDGASLSAVDGALIMTVEGLAIDAVMVFRVSGTAPGMPRQTS